MIDFRKAFALDVDRIFDETKNAGATVWTRVDGFGKWRKSTMRIIVFQSGHNTWLIGNESWTGIKFANIDNYAKS